MRALAAGAFALLAFAPFARAQVVAPDDGPAPQQQPYPQQPYAAPQQYSVPPGYVLVPVAPQMTEEELATLESHGRTYRALGAVLVALGVASAVAGLAIIIDYYTRGPFDNTHGWEPYASLGLDLGGAAMLGVGVPVLSAGLRDLRRAKRARAGRVAIAPTAISVTF